MMNLRQYNTIILDCDGVIFNSNQLKINAFRSALTDFDKCIVDSFLEYFRNNFGISRYYLIRIFIEDFLGLSFDEHLYRAILARFSKGCMQLYRTVETTENFINFMESFAGKNFFVASGSDQQELRVIFKERLLDHYFVDIFGSPANKVDIIKDIMKTNQNAVMIGDAKADKSAAHESGVDFIFMRNYSVCSELKNDSSLYTISNLGDLL